MTKKKYPVLTVSSPLLEHFPLKSNGDRVIVPLQNNVRIVANSRRIVTLLLDFKMPAGYVAIIQVRKKFALDGVMTFCNVIPADQDGCLHVNLFNSSAHSRTYLAGAKLFEIFFLRFVTVDVLVEAVLPDEEAGVEPLTVEEKQQP